MKTVFSLLTSLSVFFMPVKGLIIAVGACIFADTIMGILKSKIKNGWSSISSKRLSDIVAKILAYNAVILTIFIIDFFTISEFSQIWFSIHFLATKTIALMLIFIEMYSIHENFEVAFKKNIFKMIKDCLKRGSELKKDLADLTKTDGYPDK